MSNLKEFNIAVLPGDGIGIEVTEAALHVLQAVERKIGGFRLRTTQLPAGAGHYAETGNALPDSTVDAAGKAATTSGGIATTFLVLGLAYAVFMTLGAVLIRVPAQDWKPAGLSLRQEMASPGNLWLSGTRKPLMLWVKRSEKI